MLRHAPACFDRRRRSTIMPTESTSARDQECRARPCRRECRCRGLAAGQQINQEQKTMLAQATIARARPIRLIGFLMSFLETGG